MISLLRPGGRWGLALSVMILLTAAGIARAQDTSLSPPLSDPISSSIYDESAVTGPSSNLIPGSADLTRPFIREGISDPLGYLIETGDMSPYPAGGGLVDSYVNDVVRAEVLNDSTAASRFSEYRNNRLLMAGAGAMNTPTGRTSAAGGTLSTFNYGAHPAGSGSSRGSLGQSFLAGSSMAARGGGAAAMGGDGSFLDPNALAAASLSSSPSSLGGQPESSTGATAGVGSDMDADASSSSASGAPMGALPPPSGSGFDGQLLGTSAMDTASGMGSAASGGSSETLVGPRPGSLFPDVSQSSSSGTGFQDSTMGTAGLPYQQDGPGTSPLAYSHLGLAASPFPDMSGETTSFLHPSLTSRQGISGRAPSVEALLRESVRKARMQALISGRQVTLPSPFEQRAMERAFLAKHRGGQQRRPSRIPSVVPQSNGNMQQQQMMQP